MSTRTIAGTDVLVREGAPHDTVLLLHGIGGRAASFADLMTRWPAGRRLVAWDMPGYGNSRPIRHPWPSLTEYADRLLDVCEDIGVDQVDVVGQSLGALIGGRFAHFHVGIMRRLVLISPALGYQAAPGGTLPEAQSKRIADFNREGSTAFARARAPRLVHRAQDKPEIVEQVRSTMATLTSASHMQAVGLLASGDLIADVTKFHYRTLVLCGAEDQVTPVAGSKQVFAALQSRSGASTRHDRLHIIPDAGHAVYLEQPDAVIAAIADFLEAPE